MDLSLRTNFIREILTLFFSNFRLASKVIVVILLFTAVAPFFIGKYYTVTGEIIVLSKKLEQGYRAESMPGTSPRFLPVTLTDMETESSVLRSLPLLQATVTTLIKEGKLSAGYGPIQTLIVQPVKKLFGEMPADPSRDQVNSLSTQVLSGLEIATLPGSNVITVSYTDKDPELARTIVNALMDSFLEKRRQVMQNQAPQDFFYQKKEAFQQLVKKLENDRVDLLNKYGVASPKDELNFALQESEEESKAINQIQENKQQSERWLQYLKEESTSLSKKDVINTSLAFSFNGSGAGDEFYVDTEMKQQAKSIADLIAEYNDARFTFKPDSPRVDQLLSRLNEQKRRLETLVHNRIKEREQALLILNETLASKTGHIQALQQRLGNLKQAAAEESALLTELNAAKDAFFRYSQQFEEYRSEQASNLQDLENVKILSQPAYPLQASSPRATLVWIIGTLAALIAGVVTALISAFFGRTFVTPDQMQSALNIPVLAVFDDTAPSADLPQQWSPAGVWKWLRQPPRA